MDEVILESSSKVIIEYIMLRTETLTLIFSKGNLVHLNKVLNVNKKKSKLTSF